MAAFQKQGSGLRRGPGKRCSSDSLDSSSLLVIKGVTSGKQGRMFLSGIHMTSAPRQRFTETGAELRLAQLSKEHLNGNGGNSAILPFADSLLSLVVSAGTDWQDSRITCAGADTSADTQAQCGFLWFSVHRRC